MPLDELFNTRENVQEMAKKNTEETNKPNISTVRQEKAHTNKLQRKQSRLAKSWKIQNKRRDEEKKRTHESFSICDRTFQQG